MTNLFGKAQLPPFDKRKAVFAGTWYEGDGAKLRSQLLDYLQTADEKLKMVPCEPGFEQNRPVSSSIWPAWLLMPVTCFQVVRLLSSMTKRESKESIEFSS